MKIEKTASGSQKITISKAEWTLIGKQAGWDEMFGEDAYDARRDYRGDIEQARTDRDRKYPTKEEEAEEERKRAQKKMELDEESNRREAEYIKTGKTLEEIEPITHLHKYYPDWIRISNDSASKPLWIFRTPYGLWFPYNHQSINRGLYWHNKSSQEQAEIEADEWRNVHNMRNGR